MQIGIIYFVVIILANTVGALSGMGGGVIIKPLLDAIGAHDINSISFYSSVAVFTMAIASTLRQLKNGIKPKLDKIVLISIGSIIGGNIGNTTFNFLLSVLNNESIVQLIQITLTILSLVWALIYTRYKWKSLDLKSIKYFFLIGCFLGFLSTLLGIGGGPINVALLMWCFNMPIKEATVYSISTILFSQLSKLVTIGFTTGYGIYDLSMLIAIIPAAILGGIIGAKVSGILLDKTILKVYKTVVIVVIILNNINAIRLL